MYSVSQKYQRVSHLFNMPLCTVGRRQLPYDLLWPIAKRRTFAIESKATVTEDIGKLTKFPTAMTAKHLLSPILGHLRTCVTMPACYLPHSLIRT
jgi:hypothetical protein